MAGSTEALIWRLQLLNENIVEDKSFADDLTIKQGIVSSRAKLILRGAEIKPLFSDLCFGTLLPQSQDLLKENYSIRSRKASQNHLMSGCVGLK